MNPFRFTSEMREWIDTANISGPCVVYDAWTYGYVLVSPTVREYTENGVRKSFLARDWSTITRTLDMPDSARRINARW